MTDLEKLQTTDKILARSSIDLDGLIDEIDEIEEEDDQ